jgi:hypothetical protein
MDKYLDKEVAYSISLPGQPQREDTPNLQAVVEASAVKENYQ